MLREGHRPPRSKAHVHFRDRCGRCLRQGSTRAGPSLDPRLDYRTLRPCPPARPDRRVGISTPADLPAIAFRPRLPAGNRNRRFGTRGSAEGSAPQAKRVLTRRKAANRPKALPRRSTTRAGKRTTVLTPCPYRTWRETTPKRRQVANPKKSGWGGIRTPGGISPTAVFKTAALDHSATHPNPCFCCILAVLMRFSFPICTMNCTTSH
jgi:hypothetical protein